MISLLLTAAAVISINFPLLLLSDLLFLVSMNSRNPEELQELQNSSRNSTPELIT